ncbi:MAG: hypothetical protein JXB34_10940 [Bacteroidales bacterium]|nr:hypothetical protein [Bacteroidales bacterium]
MKTRVINKKRNRPINVITKLKHRHPEGNHKEFFTYDLLGYSDFCDCYFTGTFQNQRVLFNAAFTTLRLHAYNILGELVDKQMDERFPNRYDNHKDWKEMGDINEWFNGPEENRYKNWPLQQKYNSEEDEIRQSILKDEIEVQPYIEVLPDYEFGVGIHGAFPCTTFEKPLLLEIIKLVRTQIISEYLQPVFFGEKQKFYSQDIEHIQHSTPLIIKRS